MTEIKDKVTIGLRLASMLVDHFAMTFIAMFIIMPGFALSAFDAFNLDHDPSSFGFGGMSFLFAFGFSAYFNKDIFNGRSPAKRILKMQVIDNKTGLVAIPLKCLVRNLSIVLWPIEVIFVLINPKRRLGDKIAGTRIDYVENPEKTKMDWSKFTVAILIAICFSALISLPFILKKSQWKTDKVSYVESSFNKTKSDNFEESENKISDLLTSKFPLDSHICFLKFVSKESSSMSTRQRLYAINLKEE